MISNLSTQATSIGSGLISGRELPGVQMFQLSENIDQRGSFTEVFKESWNPVITPVQWSVVTSLPGVFRGMHFHQRHDELFCLVKGSGYIGLKDLRPESTTYLETSVYQLFGEDMVTICFERGILHGWYFCDHAMHLQAVSESFEDYNNDDNHGCRWDDKDLGIDWPFDEVIISERSRDFPDLKALMKSLSEG